MTAPGGNVPPVALPPDVRRELRGLVRDARAGDLLCQWFERLAGRLISPRYLPQVTMRDRKRIAGRVAQACAELIAALDEARGPDDGDSLMLQLLSEVAASSSAGPAPENLAISEVYVSVWRLRCAAEAVAQRRAPPGRQLDDHEAAVLEVLRQVLIACGVRDAVSEYSKMGQAFGLFIRVVGLPRSDVRSLLEALRRWREAHPEDPPLVLGLWDHFGRP